MRIDEIEWVLGSGTIRWAVPMPGVSIWHFPTTDTFIIASWGRCPSERNAWSDIDALTAQCVLNYLEGNGDAPGSMMGRSHEHS